MQALDNAIGNAMTRKELKELGVEFRKVTTPKGEGHCFDVFYNGREYPNFTSSAVKTHRGAMRNAVKFLNTDKFSWYGNAE